MLKSNVHTLPIKARKPAPRRKPVKIERPSPKRAVVAAGGILTVGAVLTGLSLSHLATGVQLVTGASTIESWALAVGVDVGFIATESAVLTAPYWLRDKIEKHARPTIIGTLALSAALNALAFGTHAEGWMIVPAAGFGLAIPAMIFKLMRIGAILILKR